MSQIKNAQIRYRVIDRCLRNKYKPFPSKMDIREACEDAIFGSIDGENICDSTIEKDLFAMRMDHDAPIKYSKKNRGYFYEDEDYSINDIPLNEDDIDAIKFAANTLIQFKEVDLFKSFGSALDKIFDRISIADDPTDGTIDRLVQFESSNSKGDTEFLSPILKAIRERLIVEFLYKSFSSKVEKRRRVAPLLLKQYQKRWYLISQDLKKDRITTYALDRMTNLELTEDYFLDNFNFNSDAYFEHAVGITSIDGKPENVLLKVDNQAANYLITQPLHKSQEIIKKGKNRTSFSLKVFVTEELIRSLLSYAGEIEVESPIELREELSKRSKKLIKQNS
mgnify:CR=1 FL=1